MAAIIIVHFVPFHLPVEKAETTIFKNTALEAKKAVDKGFKEIILTGVNIGDFGKSTGENFLDLLKALENVEGLKRLRLGSIEPNLLKDEIIKLGCQFKSNYAAFSYSFASRFG